MLNNRGRQAAWLVKKFLASRLIPAFLAPAAFLFGLHTAFFPLQAVAMAFMVVFVS
ncbi:MAG: hypothetical protein JSV08_09355 [Acidobacteriota bacterium]|nr:MAG: hypothetical protein JSV08_09355 [Acidobacteriota bacterium]